MLALTERRLAAEWELLQALAECNPGRLTGLCRRPASFLLRLHRPIAVPADRSRAGERVIVHDLRLEFPVHFPAVPMELFLAVPVFHPNIHPDTGFVCLWDRHRVSNTVEHALHKAVAMLAGALSNGNAPHVMQPDALQHPWTSEAAPLYGLPHDLPGSLDTSSPRRQRLH